MLKTLGRTAITQHAGREGGYILLRIKERQQGALCLMKDPEWYSSRTIWTAIAELFLPTTSRLPLRHAPRSPFGTERAALSGCKLAGSLHRQKSVPLGRPGGRVHTC